MKLPNRDRAYIQREKITEYLLAEVHSEGASKALFFLRLGFDKLAAGRLEQYLLRIAQSGEVTSISESEHGTKYVVDGLLELPDREPINLRTVWVLDMGSDRPRLVTAYPRKKG